jgi:hypothetical protein
MARSLCFTNQCSDGPIKGKAFLGHITEQAFVQAERLPRNVGFQELKHPMMALTANGAFSILENHS